ncbi:MAG: hypothetical protein ABF629_07455 [Sporolactobacillus sp.]|uniref:YczE/YyaS/YitT family protein n=1 Tax=Sporolactobacillus sp. STSJ-5 TaxID=2965076 RepID=UPI002103663F|nr:hypothetical protein [Sporolactobacillus sp. STSJ-5]MCQ2010757.1 hypothetical protein [Sporolactobacillus sp. STSJ-5]
MKLIVNLIKLFAGLFLFALGAVCTINANLGLQPWDVLHQGLSRTFPITIGLANIFVAFIIVILNRILGEKIGFGTLANMLFIGLFMDMLMLGHLVPTASHFVEQLLMVLIGLAIISLGTYLYISAGFGAGPRDGLMVVVARKTHQSVRLIRTVNEGVALIIGWLLGGSVGIGTVVMVSLIGIFVQATFKLFRFDVKNVHHIYLDRHMFTRIFSKKEPMNGGTNQHGL